ncbi:MAG: hypothetical protein RQ966_13210 [Acetobacteraceae bacterium]|nr:hypothetical protein [Acetobacteraceae bacterium]
MPDALPGPASLASLAALGAELGDLKRLRDASSSDSLASQLFRRGWAALVGGQPLAEVALASTGSAVAACRLGGIDRGVLETAGLAAVDAVRVIGRAFDEMAEPVEAELGDRLRRHLDTPLWCGTVPAFAEALIRQPRAGATCPGKPRIVLEPPEGHGDHCMIVAVLACLLAPRFGAAPETAFLAGMAHHLHNAHLPDSGFAGEVLLGEHLAQVMSTLFARELATLPARLADETRVALDQIGDADNPVGRAFNAADVIDRVLQMRHYDQVAQFRTVQALEDLDLVHVGPVQAFHYGVLRDAGLV